MTSKIIVKGIVHVTGESDTGKTTFALESGAMPGEIVFFDHDIKTSAIVQELKDAGAEFAQYHNLVEIAKGKKPVEFHKACLDLIDKIPKTGIKAIIWDNFAPFENTFHPYVVKNPKEFRDVWSPKGQIKGAEMWIASFEHESAVLNQLQSLADIVILTSHLKNHNINGVRTGKMIPNCKKPLIEKAQLRIWLRHNPKSSKPTGLILKRISKREVTDLGIETMNVLPRRMETCTWREIRKYWDDPVGDNTPGAEQLPNEFELSLLDGHLTEDQKKVFEVGVMMQERADAEDAADAALAESMLLNRVREIKEEKPDISIRKLAKILKEEDQEITIPELSNLLAKKNNQT